MLKLTITSVKPKARFNPSKVLTYDPGKVTITFAGVEIKGYAAAWVFNTDKELK